MRNCAELGKILLDESGILSFGIQNTAQGIRIPTYDWNQEGIVHSCWNPESKLP